VFVARLKYEHDLDLADETKNKGSDPYDHDDEFGPFTDETERALLALQENFGLWRRLQFGGCTPV